MTLKEREMIERSVCDVYQECGIRSFPVDCMAVLRHYGLTAISSATFRKTRPELYALCLKASDDAFLFLPRRLIIYHDRLRTRTRFSLMHELGHFLLGHTESTPGNEVQANYFASCMLMPRPAIGLQKTRDIRQLAHIFGTSIAATEIALTDYQRWLDRQKYYPASPWDQKLKMWLTGAITKDELKANCANAYSLL